MPDHITYRGFTQSYTTSAIKLITPVSILPIASRDKSLRGVPVSLEALWDTGAMKTCMRPELRDRLKLQMYRIGSSVTMEGIGGKVKADFTIVLLFLTRNFGIEYCPVYVLDFPGSADIIIGMDIIRLGDFVVCNADSKTSFSFAMPPFQDRINFADKAEALNRQNRL
ncbi:MAG: retropepsin-like domain-containing protein [Treponema sp.]|jgi:hypothetical protein|nr:retropepsin-like domain-containing protein [Treponema sp.]